MQGPSKCEVCAWDTVWGSRISVTEWLPRFTRKYPHAMDVSRKIGAFFLYPGVSHLSRRQSHVCIPLCQHVIRGAGQPASLHPERRVTGLRPLLTWEGGAPVNMKELCLPLAGGLSVSELIRTDPNNSSNVDEPSMRLGADTWRNMVGGGPFSGL